MGLSAAMRLVTAVAVVPMAMVITMVMVMGVWIVDGWAGDLVADEQEHRFEQVEHAALRGSPCP